MARTKVAPVVDTRLEKIAALPLDWHGAGTVTAPVLRAIDRWAGSQPVAHSVETGCGRSTLVISQHSGHHTVFALDDGERTGSVSAVRSSELLASTRTHFVLGPTQVTLPAHRFTEPLDLAMLDGPHAFPFVELEYFHIYPHLAPGALLIVDDLHIPTVNHLWRFLCADSMFRRLEVVGTTGFLRRTGAPVFPVDLDGWEHQNYNVSRFPAFVSPRQWVRSTAGRLLKGRAPWRKEAAP